MLTDAHCHLQAEEFDADREAVIARCHDRGMRCVVVGNNLDDSQHAVALAEAHEGLFATVGLHPMFMSEEEWDQAAFDKLLEHPKVMAVGEIGLDYYRMWADTPDEEQAAKLAQQQLFRDQVVLAKSRGKPVVVHCRDAYDDMLRLIADARDVPMMIHTFLGDAVTAQKFLDLNIPLSFSGIVTFEDEDPVLASVRAVPLDMMMIETDAPHLAPVPYRGRRNEPIYVEATATKIAELKGVSVDEVIEATAETARRFFRLP